MLRQVLQRVAAPFGKTEIRCLLFSYHIVSVVYSLGIQLYGPFLRSMVVCETPLEPGAKFSGSSYCGDAHYVLSVAQSQEGALVSMKLVVHALAGPFLGSLADRLGRRPMLLMSLGGFMVAFFLFFVTSISVEIHSFYLVAFCFVIEGATNAFNVVYMSMLADLTLVADRASAFAAYQMTGAVSQVLAQLLSVRILRMNLASYATAWFLLFILLLFDVIFAWYTIRETLKESEKTPKNQERRASSVTMDIITGPFQLLRSERFLCWWLLSLMITNLGAGLGGVLASFTIAVYGWHPGDYQAFTWISQLLRAGSLAVLSPIANTRWRPAGVALLSTVAGVASSLFQVCSPFSPAMLLGPGYVMDSLAFSSPADAAFLSLQFDAEKQARVNAVQHLFANLSTSVSIALFSSPALFQPEARGQAAMRPFVVTFVLVAVGGVIKALLIKPHLRLGSSVRPLTSSARPMLSEEDPSDAQHIL